MGNEPEIGDMDEGVVEGGEDPGNTEDEFTYSMSMLVATLRIGVLTPLVSTEAAKTHLL